MIKTYAGIPYEEIVRRYADDITRLCVVWTQNECRDYHKQFWNRNVDIGYDPKQYERQSVLQVDDPDTEQLVKALRSLSFKYREVLVLYYYEEYNTSEIAKLLNVSVNTVKSRLRRGKEKLADILKED